jgi:hypothetical protein
MQKRKLVFLLALAAGTVARLTAALIPPFFFDSVVAIGYRPLVAVVGTDGKPVAQRGPFVQLASGFLYGHFVKKVDDTTNTYALYLVTNQHVLTNIDANTPGVGGPIDVLRITARGPSWLQHKPGCPTGASSPHSPH